MSKHIKIGIIDSGMEQCFARELMVNIVGAVAVTLNKKEKTINMVEYNEGDVRKWLDGKINHINDENGHGTGILSIIWQSNRFNPYVIAKVLDNKNEGDSITMIEALKWMINQKVNLINMSIGTTDKSMKNDLYKLLDLAKKRNITVIAAGASIETYPASFNNVYTIGDTGLKKLKIIHSKIDKYLEMDEVFVWQNKCWQYAKISTSKACAYYTGLIASNGSLVMGDH